MKNKTNLIEGIIFCAQGIILDAFALYAIIPILSNLWFGDLYDSEKSVAIFTLIVWIGVSIASSVVLNMGKKKVIDYYSDSSNSVNSTSTYHNAQTTTPIFKDNNTSSVTPSGNEWKCPKCGKINQNYTGTCGCGQQKPAR